MPRKIAIIVDKGDVWEITGTTVQLDEYVVDPEMVVEIFDDELFNFIKKKLKTSLIQYPKDIVGNLIGEDLFIEDIDPLTLLRETTINKAREYISTRLNAVSTFEFFEFIICNNILLDKGFIITDENRRKKYLEVIESGDLDLIDTLETFLNTRDKMEEISGWYKNYKEFERNIQRANKELQIKDLYKIFVQIFE
jgi:hypothetical protein